MNSRLTVAETRKNSRQQACAKSFQFSLAGLMLATSILGGVLGLWLHFSPVELFAFFVGLPVCGMAFLLGFIVVKAGRRNQTKIPPKHQLVFSKRSVWRQIAADPATIVIGVLLLGVVVGVIVAFVLIVNSQVPLF